MIAHIIIYYFKNNNHFLSQKQCLWHPASEIIIARSQNTADNGDIVVALVGDEAVVKKIYRSKDKVELRFSNPAYLLIKITTASNNQAGENSQGSVKSAQIIIKIFN